MTSAEADSTEQWSIFCCGVPLWLTQVLASVLSPKLVLSAETFFFFIKMGQVWGLTSSEANKYWGMTAFFKHAAIYTFFR